MWICLLAVCELCIFALWSVRRKRIVLQAVAFLCAYTHKHTATWLCIHLGKGWFLLLTFRLSARKPPNHATYSNTMTYVLDYRHIKLMRILSFVHYLRIVFCAGLIIIKHLGIWQQSYKQTNQIHTPKQKTNRAAAPTGRKFYRNFVNTHTQNTRACVYEYEVECEFECVAPVFAMTFPHK